MIRHGETEWTLSKQHTGRTDLPLTENGRAQAAAVAPRLAGRTFAKVLTSPLGRAADTCRLAGLGDQAVTDDDLLEVDYGEYEGVTTADIRKTDPDWNLWRDGSPGGETIAQAAERVDRVIAGLRELDGDAALFAHGHILRVLAARWLELPGEEGGRFALSTATLSVLGWEREMPVVWLWNDGSHLES